LHEEFLEMLNKYHIEIVSFAEAKPTLVTALKFPFQFVSLNSAGNALRLDVNVDIFAYDYTFYLGLYL